jgi:hypothetical protein
MWTDKGKHPKTELEDEEQEDRFYKYMEQIFRNSGNLKSANDVYYMRKKKKMVRAIK